MKKRIGTITHYFPHPEVAVIKLEAELKEGDKISIAGATTDITQTIESMQVKHKQIKSAKKGDDVGLKVNGIVRKGDAVYLE